MSRVEETSRNPTPRAINSLTKPVPSSRKMMNYQVVRSFCISVLLSWWRLEEKGKVEKKMKHFLQILFSFQTSRNKVKPWLKSICTETLRKLKLFSFGKEFQGNLKETKSNQKWFATEGERNLRSWRFSHKMGWVLVCLFSCIFGWQKIWSDK